MKTLTKITVLLLLTSIILVGCSPQATSAQTIEMQTAIASTLAAMQTQISANASQPAATDAPTIIAPTATAAPTALPTATAQVTTASTPVKATQAAAALGPSLRVGHVEDLNIPDGTFVDINLDFIKIWRIKNVGTATWAADTKVVPTDYNPLNASAYTLGQVVSPGQTVEIHMLLKAPETAGHTYKAKFMLETANGTKFGIGSNFDQPFWVEIITH